MQKVYITTPIYYVNDVPHIGHAYTTIAADVLARYYRLRGDEVFLLTGTDEHGAKIAEAAEKAGKNPKEFVDGLALKFVDSWDKLNISYNQFFRTTDPNHHKVVEDFVKRLIKADCIIKKQYEGLYCTGCEKFYQPGELKDGRCPDHDRELEVKREENYFFKLSKFKDLLLRAIESGEYQILPESRKNEVVGKIKQGLEDISISRGEVKWGIPYPGDEKQTIYVWVDALINYWSATKIYDNPPLWPADLHLMAKDILWFHAVIWPAMLMAVGDKLPKKIFAHGFFTIDGKKMSKSLGNVLDPNKLIKKYGADAVRYALLREFPFGEDGDISEDKIAQRYEKDLANGLGNLLNRTITMICRYKLEDKILDKQAGFDPFQLKNHKISINGEERRADEHFSLLINNLDFYSYLEDIWLLYVRVCNNMIDEKQPWILAKEGKNEDLFGVLSFCYENLYMVKILVEPFMPETAKKMEEQLRALKATPLFPRLN